MLLSRLYGSFSFELFNWKSKVLLVESTRARNGPEIKYWIDDKNKPNMQKLCDVHRKIRKRGLELH